MTKNKNKGLSSLFERIILILISFIVIGRLFIWKFFKDAGVLEKVNMSNVAISFFIFAIIIFYLIKLFIEKGSLPRTIIDLPINIFLLICGASVLYSVDRNISLRSYIVLLSLIGLFKVLIGCLNTKERVKAFIKFLIFAGVIVAVLGIKEYIFYCNINTDINTNLLNAAQKILFYMAQTKRVGSLLGWPNVLAAYLMLIIPLAFIFFFIEKNKLQKVFFALAFFVMVAAMLLTYSLGGWLCFFIAVFISMLFYKKVVGTDDGGISFNKLLLICVIFFSVFGSMVIVNRIKDRGASNLIPRMSYLNTVLSVINEHPIRGSGFNSFQVANRRYIYSKTEGYSMFVHNSYLQIWSEVGILGVLVFIFVLLKVIESSCLLFKRLRVGEDGLILMGLLCSVGAFMIHNIFSFTFLKPNIAFFWWVQLAVLLAWIKILDSKQERAVAKGLEFNRNPILITAVFVILLMVCSKRIYVSDHYLHKGQRVFNAGDIDQAFQCLIRAQKENPINGKVTSALGVVAFQRFASSRDIKFLNDAEYYLQRSVKMMPLAPENFQMLSRVYYLKGDKVKAKEIFDRYVELAPYKHL
ncbi:MAG: O-antigen ligase family protein [Candidatus Omnitrophica bacterium]|nr:O-antigen ligase family protein [Candidatus Omnitrophota bacterium]MBU1995824.1 O-antigen ligase family protein [Candidatus Omnitrophota bacterium]